MSADVLREAARLMRERAEDSTRGLTEDWWSVHAYSWLTKTSGVPPLAEHLAIFGDPAVALAVADWLEEAATELGRRQRSVDDLLAGIGAEGRVKIDEAALEPSALAVAVAYLGREA